jgi:hypothetical protein
MVGNDKLCEADILARINFSLSFINLHSFCRQSFCQLAGWVVPSYVELMNVFYCIWPPSSRGIELGATGKTYLNGANGQLS